MKLIDVLLIVSVGFSVGAITCLHFSRAGLRLRLVACLMTSLGLIATLVFLTAKLFTGRGVNPAFIYHIKYGLEGAGIGGYGPYVGIGLLLLAAALGLPSLILFSPFFRSKKSSSPRLIPGAYLLLSLSLLTNPLVFQISKNKVEEIVSSHLNPENFFVFYREPKIQELDSKHKNIVFIYLESFERTFLNQDLFPGLANNLLEFERQGITFTDLNSSYMTSWTIGGMVASQCGIPLLAPRAGNSMSGMDSFLPQKVCLGDLLKEHGYQLQFMGGASIEFAGKGKFYRDHGFQNVFGYHELTKRQAQPQYRSSWGLYDDELLEMAFKDLDSLSKSQPFGLFILTLDTHAPRGLPSHSCHSIRYRDGSNPYLNAIACSDHLVGEFVRKIQNSAYGGNTLIAIASDHLAPPQTASNLLAQTARKNLLILLDPSHAKPQAVEKEGSTLDISPTIAKHLGFSITMGLGRDLFSETSLFSIYGNLKSKILSWKNQLESFWSFPRLNKDLSINAKAELLTIGGRSFKLPVIVEMGKNLDSRLHFEFNSKANEQLAELIKKFSDSTATLWIDRCHKMPVEQKLKRTHYYCYQLRGTHTEVIEQGVDSYTIVTASEIKEAVGFREKPHSFATKRVAHAGGGIDGLTYTNSYEALGLNYKKGFELFEIDFSFTKDGRLVCMHDWKQDVKISFGLTVDEAPDFQTFKKWNRTLYTYRKCDISGLAEWMMKHPKTNIVTDVKQHNLKALQQIAKTYPDLIERFIPQIYSFEEFESVRDLGFDKIIWTLYRYSGSNQSVTNILEQSLEELDDTELAITVSRDRYDSRLSKRLEQMGIPLFIHTVNDLGEIASYQKEHQSAEVYTDFLAPY